MEWESDCQERRPAMACWIRSGSAWQLRPSPVRTIGWGGMAATRPMAYGERIPPRTNEAIDRPIPNEIPSRSRADTSERSVPASGFIGERHSVSLAEQVWSRGHSRVPRQDFAAVSARVSLPQACFGEAGGRGRFPAAAIFSGVIRRWISREISHASGRESFGRISGRILTSSQPAGPARSGPPRWPGGRGRGPRRSAP